MENNQRRFRKLRMNIKYLVTNFRIIMLNYQKILKNILYFLAYLVIIFSSSLIITLPIWYIATHFSTSYTIIVLLTVISIIILTIFKKSKKWFTKKQKSGINSIKIIMIPLKKISIFILFFIGFYGIIFAFSLDLFIVSFLLSLAYLLVLGHFIFISRGKKDCY